MVGESQGDVDEEAFLRELEQLRRWRDQLEQRVVSDLRRKPARLILKVEHQGVSHQSGRNQRPSGEPFC